MDLIISIVATDIDLPESVFFDHLLQSISYGFVTITQPLVEVDSKLLIAKHNTKRCVRYFLSIIFYPGSLAFGTSDSVMSILSSKSQYVNSTNVNNVCPFQISKVDSVCLFTANF